MSYIFEADGKIVWSPALHIGKLYVTIAGQLAEALQTDCGLAMMASDYWLIDPEQLEKFFGTLLKAGQLNHPVMRELTQGFTLITFVLLQRTGSSATQTDLMAAELKEAAAMIARAMPT